jgi:ribosomal protein S21|tara:strand:+ start:167 stop:427 length:261 start_codon:yes stop_codon:yes gene_type:complete
MSKKTKRQQSILPGAEVGVRVIKTKRNPNGDIELALRSLKKELKVSGKIQRLRSLQQFESKKSIQRKQKERARYFQQQASKELLKS